MGHRAPGSSRGTPQVSTRLDRHLRTAAGPIPTSANGRLPAIDRTGLGTADASAPAKLATTDPARPRPPRRPSRAPRTRPRARMEAEGHSDLGPLDQPKAMLHADGPAIQVATHAAADPDQHPRVTPQPHRHDHRRHRHGHQTSTERRGAQVTFVRRGAALGDRCECWARVLRARQAPAPARPRDVAVKLAGPPWDLA